MDPNLFHLDWERAGEVLATIVLLSMLVERALSIVFESGLWIEHVSKKERHFKEVVALAVASAVCWHYSFDAFSMLVLADKTSHFGEIVTGAVIAGGSKGSVALFRQFLGFKSTARRTYEAERTGPEPGRQDPPLPAPVVAPPPQPAPVVVAPPPLQPLPTPGQVETHA